MKSCLYSLLLCCTLLLMGCPLSTEEPIQGPTPAKVPSWLPGKWAAIKDGTERSVYGVAADKSAPGRLTITEIKENTGISPVDAYSAVLSIIKGRLFISVYEKGESDISEGYYHYSIDCTNGRNMDLIPIGEYKLPATSSGKELGELIAKATPDSYLDRTASRALPEEITWIIRHSLLCHCNCRPLTLKY